MPRGARSRGNVLNLPRCVVLRSEFRISPPPMQVASSGQSICLGEQQVPERLEPDLAAVEAADDAVERSPLPDRHGVHTSAGRQPLRPGVQVAVSYTHLTLPTKRIV